MHGTSCVHGSLIANKRHIRTHTHTYIDDTTHARAAHTQITGIREWIGRVAGREHDTHIIVYDV